ncbi:MAG TPA: hypothetical protein VG497_28540, partial [Kribbella sp.]|nr:hypothetical protein [Kribbella sp.]
MPLVDLDDPEELRARWTALAAVAHATGFDRRWYADADGYHHQDETASVLRMVRLADGRAVLWGFHTQHSRTAGEDLLAGSPDWIGQPEVRQRQAAGELGFVYGAFNATWARASYPGDPWQPVDDGFAAIGEWITSDEAAADEMIEWVAEWADYLGGLDELRPHGVELIRAASAPGLSPEVLGAFFAHFKIDPRSPLQPDLAAGSAAAEDFTRNFAEPASFAEDPDTAEVSVVEPPVIGENPPQEDEESFVVPPGISPFTGQPIDSPAGYAEPESDEEAGSGDEILGFPADRSDDYGVVPKRQGWLRRRKHDQAPEPEPVAPPRHDPATPGTYIPDDTPSSGLPVRPYVETSQQPPGGSPQQPSAHSQTAAPGSAFSSPLPTYDHTLPSSEPPRVGGGVYEGDDFYNSLFADAPAAAAPAPDQDWETTEQPSWSDQEPTSEYTPFTDDTNPPATEWTGPRWVNGKWVEAPAAAGPEVPADSPFAPGAGSEVSAGSPFAPDRDASPSAPSTQPAPDAAARPSSDTAAPAVDQAPGGASPEQHARLSVPADSPFARTADDAEVPANSPFAPAASVQPLEEASQGSPTGSAPGNSVGLEDDDAPTAEIAAVLDPESAADAEEDLASFTGPSPFAPVTPTEPAPAGSPSRPHEEPAAGAYDEPSTRAYDGPTGRAYGETGRALDGPPERGYGEPGHIYDTPTARAHDEAGRAYGEARRAYGEAGRTDDESGGPGYAKAGGRGYDGPTGRGYAEAREAAGGAEPGDQSRERDDQLRGPGDQLRGREGQEDLSTRPGVVSEDVDADPDDQTAEIPVVPTLSDEDPTPRGAVEPDEAEGGVAPDADRSPTADYRSGASDREAADGAGAGVAADATGAKAAADVSRAGATAGASRADAAAGGTGVDAAGGRSGVETAAGAYGAEAAAGGTGHAFGVVGPDDDEDEVFRARGDVRGRG